jgi:HK97 family phage prohead protease
VADDLDMDDQFAAVGHDYAKVVGRKSAGTLKLTPDAKGIRAVIDLPDTSFARDLRESHGRGDVRGWSFAFRALEDIWSLAPGTSTPLRTVTKMRTIEVSPGVAQPCYPATASARGAFAPSAATRLGLNDAAARIACTEFLREVATTGNLKLRMIGWYYTSTPRLYDARIAEWAKRDVWRPSMKMRENMLKLEGALL